MLRPNLSGIIVLGLLLLGWGATASSAAQNAAAAPARPPGAAAPAVCDPVFSENFDTGTLGQFAATPANSWGVTTYQPHSGCCSAFIVGGFNCCGSVASPAAPATTFDSYLTTNNPFTIPATASSATLTLWWHGVLYAPPPPATVAVEISGNGGASWETLDSWAGVSNVWLQRSQDLMGYRGVPLLLRLHMVGNNTGPDYNVGIDDVVVTVAAPACPSPTPLPPPPPTATVTPTATHFVHGGTFEDVPPGSGFWPYIECMWTRGIASGYPCGGPGEPCYNPAKPYFRPNADVTRGQMSKMVVNAAGWSDPVPSTQQTFEDVPPGSTFWTYIERLAGHGAVGGYPCGGPFEPCVAPGNRPYFRPNNPMTRGQLAKIDASAAQFSETPATQTFEDVPPSSTFYRWIEQIAGRGIVSGYPCGGPGEPCLPPGFRPYFRPANNVTRAQTSKIVTDTFFPNCQNPTTPTVTPIVTPPPTWTPSETWTPAATWTPSVTPTPTPTP